MVRGLPVQFKKMTKDRTRTKQDRPDLSRLELAVMDVSPSGLKLVELADGVTEDEARAATEATLVAG